MGDREFESWEKQRILLFFPAKGGRAVRMNLRRLFLRILIFPQCLIYPHLLYFWGEKKRQIAAYSNLEEKKER
jgi:hypothetical protein